MKTVKEFAALLDEIKQDEFGSPKYKITDEQLLHFANVRIPKRYKTFQIRKKSGGQREINAPCYQLAIVLYFTNIVLKSLYTPSPSAMGFAEGRSVVENAKIHVGHHYVFNIDLKDFFPSIPQPRVWARLQLPPFNFTREIANVVAGLCCHTNADKSKSVLPQGAATSPLLTNAICDTLDRRMRGVAKRFGLHYSRYADDMTFSSMHNVYQEGSDFRVEIKRIIEEQGFMMNEAKTRLFREGRRQEVTGLTVNEVVNVSRQYISDLRWILHVWETEGYAKAYSKFYPKYKKEKGYIKKGEPVMENVIGGKLNYLRMVKGANNEVFLKLQMRYDKLQQIVYVDNETDKRVSYVYVQPYKMADFLADFSTSISLEVTSKKKLVGKCVLAGMEKVLPISKSTQKSLCPDLDNKQEGDVITAKKLEKCFVTLCRSKGKNFWLITEFEPQRSKCLSIQNAQIDIDELLTLWEKNGLEDVVETFQKHIKYGTSIPSVVEMKKENKIVSIPLEDSIDDFKDIQEFIHFLTHNKSLTRVQQKKCDALLAKAVIDGHISSDNINYPVKNNPPTPFKALSALDTVHFFALFNKPMGLKYLTHDFDAEDDGRPRTIEALYNQAKDVLEENEFPIPPSLWLLIYNYIEGKKEWIDTFEQAHSSCIKDPSWIDWSVKNKMHPINNPEYAKEIMTFRSTVRLVAPALKDICDYAKKGLALNVTEEKLDKADFYTNTYILFIVVRRILLMMNRRADKCPNITIAYKRKTDSKGRMLRQIIISQEGSFADKTIDDLRDRLAKNPEAGDFGSIRKSMNGYCIWQVESLWDGQPFRWNILKTEDMPETEAIAENEVAGFTHIFSFYIV